MLPEDLGKSCAKRLLEEIYRVGAEEKIQMSSLRPMSQLKSEDEDHSACLTPRVVFVFFSLHFR